MPGTWKQLSGPADWFDCRIPPKWAYTQDEDAIVAYSPDGRARVTLRSFWHPSRHATPKEVLDPRSLFPGAFALRKLAPLQIEQASFGVSGYVPAEPERPLLRRVLAPAPKRSWQAWAVRSGSVCVIATIEQTSDAPVSRAQLRACRRILDTLDFHEHPVAPPEEFTKTVFHVARRRFEDEVAEHKRLQLAVGDARISLLNYYRAYVREPETFDEIAEAVMENIERLLNWDGSDLEVDLDLVRDRIMPMLVPESVWRDSLTEFVSAQWIAGLRIMYVVDEHDAYWYIREELLDSWDLDPENLHEIALLNLHDYFERDPSEITAVDNGNGPRLLMPANADAYNSVRLLHQPFHRRLQRLLGPEFAVAIPNRDFFVAVSLKSTEILERVRGKVASDYQTMDHPLTDRILLVSTDGVSEYCD